MSFPTASKPDAAFADHCCELLADAGLCRAKRMFGGWAIFVDGLSIAWIVADELFLKIDAVTKPAFIAAGGRAFVYEAPTKRIEMSYATPPHDTLDARHFMRPWARLAMEAALRTANAKKAPKPSAGKALGSDAASSSKRSSPPTASTTQASPALKSKTSPAVKK